MSKHALYRYFADDGALLYVGITNDMSRRMGQHADRKDWWSEVRGVTVDWYPDRPSVLAAEARAVNVEQPRHNIRLRRKAGAVRARSGDTAARLVWVCATCATPVADGTGYLHVDYRDIAAVQRHEQDCWQPSGPAARVLDLSKVLEGPGPATWRVHHRACDPNPDSNDYWFDVARARTLPQLIDWTAHLLEKDWLPYTNWSLLLRRCAPGVNA